jgi:aryl-alcohol dehydrogenase-like predicted oxidoreductase
MAVEVEQIRLRDDFSLPRIVKGGWQIADDHSDSRIAKEQAAADMFAFVDAGITAFDCGDIYVGVEEKIGYFLGQLRARSGAEAAARIKVATKFVPAFLDKQGLRSIDRRHCQQIIDRSLKRLRQDRLDLVQHHWWDYDTPGNVETALILRDLQRAGKIHHLGATNYDVPHMREMLDAGVDLVSHQVQYSLLDRRPENGMVALCARANFKLLCYGVLAGGLLSETWLGIPDPGRPALENVSLDKYYRIVQDFGGWSLFQELLAATQTIARKHGVSITNVATRYVLERPGVGAAIIGARNATRIPDTVKVFSFSLDAADYALLDPILARSAGPTGDCYGLDRDQNRDALEEVKTEYLAVENGALVRKTRAAVVVDEPYGHYLKQPTKHG